MMLRERKKRISEDIALESEEQEKLIESFKRSNQISNSVFQRWGDYGASQGAILTQQQYAIAIAGTVFALLKLFLSTIPVIMPDLHFPLHAVAGWSVSTWYLVVMEVIGAALFIVTALLGALDTGAPVSYAAAGLGAAALLLLSIPTFGTDLASFITWAWLGGLNAFVLGSLWYARYSMQSLEKDIRKLESLRYPYKRL